MVKVLIFGDIVGKPGRQALAQVLPKWREEYSPSLVLANVENLAHGKGVTSKTMAEMDVLGFDAYTSGNHVLDQKDLSRACFEGRRNLIRPANYMGGWPGQGWVRITKKLGLSLRGGSRRLPASGGKQSSGSVSRLPRLVQSDESRNDSDEVNFLVINLNGKVFFDEEKLGGIKNPFWTADELLAGVAKEGDIIIVDLHAEATSEKIALGLHLDGRVNFLYGTHSHVPTADLRVLPQGTGFVTDIGMTGPLHSVIGAKVEIALESYLDPSKKFKMEVPERGAVVVRAILVELDGSNVIGLERLESLVE